jgi:hypothetical protein
MNVFARYVVLCSGLLFLVWGAGMQACDPPTTPPGETSTGDETGKQGQETHSPDAGTPDNTTTDTQPEKVVEKPIEATPTKRFSFPGEEIPCKVNQKYEDIKSILAGGKNNPTGRGEQSGVYDPCNERVILFGGNDFQPQQCADFGPKRFKGDTWMYSMEHKNWVKVKTDTAPSARGRHAFAFDLSRKKIYIFGGRYRDENASGNYKMYNDMWAFDVNTDTWEQVQTKGTVPTARVNSAMVYDSNRDQLILFGGSSSPSGLNFNALADTYVLNLKTKTWSRITGNTYPAPRLFHAMALDGKNNRVILYGGGGNNAFTGPFINDVWALDLGKGTWSELWKAAPGGQFPPARINPTLIEDRENGRLIMFAGHDDTAIGHRNDVWTFDLQTYKWERKKAGDTGTGQGCASFCRCSPEFVNVDAKSPERRQYHTFAEIYGKKKVALFGGKTDCGYIDDTWYLDLTTFEWEKINDASQGEACKRTGRANCKELCY